MKLAAIFTKVNTKFNFLDMLNSHFFLFKNIYFSR